MMILSRTSLRLVLLLAFGLAPIPEVLLPFANAEEKSPEPTPSAVPVSTPMTSTDRPPLDWAVALAPIGFPQPVQWGTEVQCREITEEGICSYPYKTTFDGGYFFIPLSGGKRKITMWSMQVGLRSRKERGLMFGLSMGFRKAGLDADLSEFKLSGVTLASNGHFKASSWFVQPSVGWRWVLSSGLSLQMDLGLQVPIIGSASLTFDPSADGAGIDLSAEQNGVQRVGKLIAPVVTLGRLIYRL